ncbi:MAG TPA: shikimate kinase [Ktedonobacteraceae bacterium]|nr:shikimate kinase [Ktedonobacteraceae bacterium]
MRMILIGMKGCGKTTIGKMLAKTLDVPFLDADSEIESMHRRERGESLSFRQIFQRYGAAYFHALDARALLNLAHERASSDFVFACGGRTPLQQGNQAILARLGTVLFLNVEKSVLLRRILAQGIPAFFPYPDDPERSLDELLRERAPVYKRLAHLTVNIGEETCRQVVQMILRELRAYEQH